MTTLAHASDGDYDPRQPFRDYPAVRLCELLERQYELEQPFDERIVFELANRALSAEGALTRQLA